MPQVSEQQGLRTETAGVLYAPLSQAYTSSTICTLNNHPLSIGSVPFAPQPGNLRLLISLVRPVTLSNLTCLYCCHHLRDGIYCALPSFTAARSNEIECTSSNAWLTP